MKKVLVVSMAIMFAGMAAIAQAANVTFNPGSVALTCEPGKSTVAKLMANADSASSYSIYMQVGSVMTQGNLPPGWLKPAVVSLAARSGGVVTSPMDIVIDVPPDTPGGKYSAVITPEVLQSTVPVVSNDVSIVVEVSGQMSKCDGMPAFKNVKVGPESIWAPRDKKVAVDVSGTVVVAPDCEVSGTYEMESNDGQKTGKLNIGADGKFAQKIPVMVSRKGKTREGKTYNGKLAVVDAEGNGVTRGFFVKVGHDRGKKKGHYKAWKKSWKNRWQKYWRRDR